jgi:hypothetical protein
MRFFAARAALRKEKTGEGIKTKSRRSYIFLVGGLNFGELEWRRAACDSKIPFNQV